MARRRIALYDPQHPGNLRRAEYHGRPIRNTARKMARIWNKDCWVEAPSVAAKLMNDQRSAATHVRAAGASRMTPCFEVDGVQILSAPAAQTLGHCAKHPGLRVELAAEGSLMIHVAMHHPFKWRLL